MVVIEFRILWYAISLHDKLMQQTNDTMSLFTIPMKFVMLGPKVEVSLDPYSILYHK